MINLTPREHAEIIAKEIQRSDLNEADTRFHFIDQIFKKVLGWPNSAFSLEESVATGYADYHLKSQTGHPLLIVEAKRSGIYFELPKNYNQSKLSRVVKISSIFSGSSRDAMIQAQGYATDLGCEFAAITNGNQYIIFKAFERGKSWKDLSAIVIASADWFSQEHLAAIELLGYTSVTEHASLNAAFKSNSPEAREVFYPKEKINAYSQNINNNVLAATLRPLAKRYFGPLADKERKLIDYCYVAESATKAGLAGVHSLIQDSVTPFFESYGVSQLPEGDKGPIEKRIQKNSSTLESGDVIILFGGKGSGKSTFLWRALHHKPPQYIKKHVQVATVDMLNVEKDERSVQLAIWSGAIDSLDTNKLLNGDRDQLIALFSDRWDVAKRQELFDVDSNTETYRNITRDLIKSWKSDLPYVAKRITEWHKRRHRGVVIVLDNTDQLENDLQDYAFTIAQSLSKQLNCTVLIAMREERFYASKIRGLLDAYQNNAFHISSPQTPEVFRKRVEYVINEIAEERFEIDEQRRDQLVRFLRIFLLDFKRHPASPLNKFISACAHGNTRLALDLFVDLLTSGYTNAKEMSESESGWTILIHQVIRPLMTPDRLFYDEKLSKIVNIFQLRKGNRSSHFSGLRILRLLTEGQDPTAPGFMALGELKNEFMLRYANQEDFRAWLDQLLASNAVEASTRQDSYTDDIDQVKITAFGLFVLRELPSFFTYLELVATDCGIRDESACNELVRLTNEEVQLMNRGIRLKRVERRIEKAREFSRYLAKEEEWEINYMNLHDEQKFMPEIINNLEAEIEQVMRSARKNS